MYHTNKHMKPVKLYNFWKEELEEMKRSKAASQEEMDKLQKRVNEFISQTNNVNLHGK